MGGEQYKVKYRYLCKQGGPNSFACAKSNQEETDKKDHLAEPKDLEERERERQADLRRLEELENDQENRKDLQGRLSHALGLELKAKKAIGSQAMFKGGRSWNVLREADVPLSDIRGLMVSEFGALSLVTALLAGVAFALLAAPPERLVEQKGTYQAYGVLNALALLTNIANVLYCTLFTTTVNMLIDAGDVSVKYMDRFAKIVSMINFSLFHLGIILMFCSIIMFSFFMYDSYPVGYVLAVVSSAMYLLVLGFWKYIDGVRASWLAKYFYLDVRQLQEVELFEVSKRVVRDIQRLNAEEQDEIQREIFNCLETDKGEFGLDLKERAQKEMLGILFRRMRRGDTLTEHQQNLVEYLDGLFTTVEQANVWGSVLKDWRVLYLEGLEEKKES